MKKITTILLLCAMAFVMMSCSQNYSNGERVGFVNKFSEKGLLWKSWEGELNLTQTGMNSSSIFDFSIDNDNPEPEVIAVIDSAAVHGWKVKLTYHEVTGYNWFSNRGHTNYFVTAVEVLDRNMVNNIKELTGGTNTVNGGNVVDTIFVIVIDPNDVKKYIKN